LKDAEIGSSEIAFFPSSPHVLSTTVDMKTAASITLLLQAVIPAVALTHSRVALQITGGTDVPWSPTLDYLSGVVRPAYRLMGLNFRVDSTRRGYYPKGGGKVSAEVEPASSLHPVNLTAPGTATRVDLVSRCACLPRHVAERQLKSMAQFLSSSGIPIGSRTLGEEKADSPGSSVLAYATSEGYFVGADAIGAKGRRAEDVGEQAAGKLASSISSGAAVDTNLADMVAPLLSLADGTSTLRVPQVSFHLKTGLHVARLFTGCEYLWQQDGAAYVVTIRPNQGHNA
jgi:RNA 3'-phosphate cyclase